MPNPQPQTLIRQAGIRSTDQNAPPEVRNAAVVPDDSELVYTGDVNGAQRWLAMDHTMVQYRSAKGTLTFHAWSRTHFPAIWTMGASVTADAVNYDAGMIDSHYYMTVAESGGCELVKVDESTDDNNNYFDESQWGINSQQPARVASLCRVQWNGARFADLVTAGSGCTGYPNDQWPPGFPADWPPLPAGIEVSPGSLMMSVRGLGLNDAATTAVLNHTGSDVPVQVSPPARNYFSWPSGTFTAPAHGELPITVMFEGGDAPGEYRDSVRVLVGADLEVTVPVTVTVTSTYPPK